MLAFFLRRFALLEGCSVYVIIIIVLVALAAAGTNVTLDCPDLEVNEQNNTDIRWEFQGAGKAQAQSIFVAGRPDLLKQCQRCTISKAEFDAEKKIVNSELSISGVDSSHAGRFDCSYAPNIQEIIRKTDLLVLGMS